MPKAKSLPSIKKCLGATLWLLLFFYLSTFAAYAKDEIPILKATASSEQVSFGPSQTLDTNLTGCWKGKPLQSPWWITYDLGNPYQIYEISISWDKQYGAVDCNIQGSNDGVNWAYLFRKLSSTQSSQFDTQLRMFGNMRLALPLNITNPIGYRYVRIQINQAQNDYPIIRKVKFLGLPLESAGTEIGPEGGEITSSDGKVKLTVPQGALSANKRINISAVDIKKLAGLSPEGKTLLSVVECTPAGLNFSIPVTITYNLDEAQIPGTAVSLGLYENEKIYLTSEPSVVPVDGYKVTFNIRHFSTYTALAGFVSQGAPIGAGVKIPLPDLLTGSFSHSVPITTPPGRKGMQPQIALNYRSSNANSWTGLGFSLNPGYIVRSTRLRPPAYDDKKDTFYLITDAGTTELVNLVDNLYQAKIESAFTKFFKESDDSWKIVSKDGSILRFGQSSDSKETSTQGTFSWYLTRAIDTNGNYIEYNYTKDQSKVYLNRIDYTGNENGTSPANSVEFSLETRDDVFSSYISSSKIVTAKRLKEIQVKVGDDLSWRYNLEYGYSPDTNRSLLKSITQYASDDKNLPAQKLTYQQAK